MTNSSWCHPSALETFKSASQPRNRRCATTPAIFSTS